MLKITPLLIFSLIFSDTKIRIALPAQAIRPSVRAFGAVAPYIVVTLMVIVAYRSLLDTKLDEFTAPIIMPLVMLAMVAYDKLRREPLPVVAMPAAILNADALVKVATPAPVPATPTPVPASTESPSGVERRVGFGAAVFNATHESMSHIGALIMLMGLSMSVGGFIERSGMMEYFPSEFSSMVMAMLFLMVVKVLIGMVMDPFGAVVMVSATLAPIAYANGIDPVHFWMMVLTAFELGYLLPPVALNQLLTRHVLGEEIVDASDASVRHKSFYYRYERWVLPVIVMTITLLVVSFGPFFFDWGFYNK